MSYTVCKDIFIDSTTGVCSAAWFLGVCYSIIALISKWPARVKPDVGLQPCYSGTLWRRFTLF
jgi:hypothetical protein